MKSLDDQQLKDLFMQHAAEQESSMTERIMVSIDKSSKIFEYQPLISKKAWIAVGASFLFAMVYLFLQLETIPIKTPELLNILSDGIIDVANSFKFQPIQINWPNIPSTIWLAVAAFNIIGIYLIISFKWSRKIFY